MYACMDPIVKVCGSKWERSVMLLWEMIVPRIASKNWYPHNIWDVLHMEEKPILKWMRPALNAVHLFGASNVSCLDFKLCLYHFQWEYLLVECSDTKTTCSLQLRHNKRELIWIFVSEIKGEGKDSETAIETHWEVRR